MHIGCLLCSRNRSSWFMESTVWEWQCHSHFTDGKTLGTEYLPGTTQRWSGRGRSGCAPLGQLGIGICSGMGVLYFTPQWGPLCRRLGRSCFTTFRAQAERTFLPWTLEGCGLDAGSPSSGTGEVWFAPQLIYFSRSLSDSLPQLISPNAEEPRGCSQPAFSVQTHFIKRNVAPRQLLFRVSLCALSFHILFPNRNSWKGKGLSVEMRFCSQFSHKWSLLWFA